MPATETVANGRFLTMPNGMGYQGFHKTISLVLLLREYGFGLKEAMGLTNELVARGSLPIDRYPDVPEAMLTSLRELGLDVERGGPGTITPS